MNNNFGYKGPGFASLLTILFVALKLTGFTLSAGRGSGCCHLFGSASFSGSSFLSFFLSISKS